MSALCTNGNTPSTGTDTQREYQTDKRSRSGGRTSAGDGCTHERVELLVAADGELEVAGGYAFYA